MCNQLIDDYECGEILLETAKDEYHNEHQRTSVIDSKTNIVLSFSAVIFIAMMQAVNLKKIFSIKVTTFGDFVIPLILYISLIGALTAMVMSIISLVKCIFTKEYKTIDTAYFYNVKKLKYKERLYSTALAHFYIEATIINKNTNDERVRNYKRGVVLTISSVGFFVLYSVISSAL